MRYFTAMAIAALACGVLLALVQADIIDADALRFLLPLIIVVTGLSFLFGRRSS